MATGQVATQSGHQAVYRVQDGNRLVVDSSGELDILSGGKIDVESGGQVNVAGQIDIESGGALNIESGGSLAVASGGYWTVPIQTLTSTQTATNVTNFGLTVLTGTTTGPTYTLAAPVAGVTKFLSMTSSSSGATHRAVVNSNTTGVSFDTTGGNQITLATSALRGITLVAQSTTKWRIAGVYSGASIAAPRTT